MTAASSPPWRMSQRQSWPRHASTCTIWSNRNKTARFLLPNCNSNSKICCKCSFMARECQIMRRILNSSRFRPRNIWDQGAPSTITQCHGCSSLPSMTRATTNDNRKCLRRTGNPWPQAIAKALWEPRIEILRWRRRCGRTWPTSTRNQRRNSKTSKTKSKSFETWQIRRRRDQATANYTKATVRTDPRNWTELWATRAIARFRLLRNFRYWRKTCWYITVTL